MGAVQDAVESETPALGYTVTYAVGNTPVSYTHLDVYKRQDNHSMLVDLRSKYPDLTGTVAEKALVSAAITVNKNLVTFDSRSAFQTSGRPFSFGGATPRNSSGIHSPTSFR